MRILVVHNRYLQPGGEDQVFAAEVDLLRQHRHEVHTWIEDNASLKQTSAASAAANTIWSRASQRRLQQLLGEVTPDVVHFHNTFLNISPAVYYTCRRAGVPTIQTLHNYRLLCPAASFYRDGHLCEECMGSIGFWPSVVHGCWHSSRRETAVVAAMLTLHYSLRTWQRQVDHFIALTEFARHKYIEGGLPAQKITVKPNFVNLPKADTDINPAPRQEFALFVGRMSAEKGIETLLEAWRLLPNIPLKIVGDGPLLPRLQAQVRSPQLQQIELCGRLEHEEVLQLMHRAQFLIFPSTWYEGFPMTILEAFASSLPVICSRLGSLPEIVEDGKSGRWFAPGDAHDLAEKVRWAWENPHVMAEMGNHARQIVEAKYSPEVNYCRLMTIYEQAMR